MDEKKVMSLAWGIQAHLHNGTHRAQCEADIQDLRTIAEQAQGNASAEPLDWNARVKADTKEHPAKNLAGDNVVKFAAQAVGKVRVGHVDGDRHLADLIQALDAAVQYVDQLAP